MVATAPYEGSILMVIIITAFFLGTLSVTELERLTFIHQIYHLPISRNELFFTRLRILITHCLIVYIFTIGVYGYFVNGGPNKDTGAWFTYASIIIITSLVAGAILGILMRFLIRSPLLGAIPTLLISLSWLFIFIFTALPSFFYQSDRSFYHMVDIGWTIMVTIALPIFALWILLTRSVILELDDRGRLPAFLLVFLNLLVWGTVLLLIFPSDVWIAIAG